MKPSKVAIIADSGCDVPAFLAKRYNIHILPLKIIMKGRVYNDQEVSAETIYSCPLNALPTTSTPNIGDVQDLVEKLRSEGYNELLFIAISSNLSSTYANIRLALAEEEEMAWTVFDTKNISIGSGFFALWAAQKLQEGLSVPEIVKGMEDRLSDAHVFFYMDTLNNLRAGGRIGNVIGVLGEKLQLKPIISCNPEGIYHTVAMIRGRKNGLKKLLETAIKHAKGSSLTLALMHGGAEAEAESIREQLLSALPHGILSATGQINSSLAIHTGPGLVGIGVFRSE